MVHALLDIYPEGERDLDVKTAEKTRTSESLLAYKKRCLQELPQFRWRKARLSYLTTTAEADIARHSRDPSSSLMPKRPV
jgi:hypothetical protein